jgi:hypothetical protein
MSKLKSNVVDTFWDICLNMFRWLTVFVDIYFTAQLALQRSLGWERVGWSLW